MKDSNAGRQSVTVEIAGERHVLRSDVSAEYTRTVAQHVDDTIRGMPSYHTLEPFRAAILAALSITDELFGARAEVERLRGEIEAKSAEIAAVLEGAGEGGGPSTRGGE